MIIYKVTNKINKKSYIGRTKASLAERKKQHIGSSKKETNNVFHKALKELGEEAFTWEVICVCDVEKSKNLEIYYIGRFNSYEDGYNSLIVSNTNKKLNYDKFLGLRISSSLYVMLDVIAKTKGKKVTNISREALERYVKDELQI